MTVIIIKEITRNTLNKNSKIAYIIMYIDLYIIEIISKINSTYIETR